MALLSAVACNAPATSGAEEDPVEDPPEAIPVQVAPVVREPLSSLYSTSATLRAHRRATVTARTTGVVRRLVVEEGDRVDADQPLAYLEDDEQRLAQERAQTSLETFRRELERSRRLHSQGMVSDEVLETLERETADAEHAEALAELTLSRTVIRAPFRGVIVLRYLDVGATVNDGTSIFDLADVDPLYADVNVPERHAVRLHPGRPVRLSIDATGARADAVIERIAPAVDPATGTVKVTVAVPPAPGVRPGSFARVDLVTDTHEQAIVVPRAGLVAEGSRWLLYRLNEDGEDVSQLRVRLGYEETDRVEILEVLGDAAPLTPGQRVVVVGAPALGDGSRVRVMDGEPG